MCLVDVNINSQAALFNCVGILGSGEFTILTLLSDHANIVLLLLGLCSSVL